MTYTSSYQPQVPGSSVYSPFNRNGAAANPGVYPGAPSPTQPEMATDAFVPVASPEDMDRVVSSIDEKIARIRQAFSQPAPAAGMPPGQPAVAPVSQEEIQWALQLEQKVKGGQQPTPQETARYEDIAKRLAAAQQPQQPTAPGGATPPPGARDWNSWSKPFAPPGASPMPLPIAAPGSGQPVVTVPTSLRGSPQTPPAVAMTQYVPAALPSAPTAAQPQMAPQQPQAPMAPQAAAPQMGNVSQQEIQWALQLEQRVKDQRYQPTPQEVAVYENIAQRLNAAQAPAQQPVQAPAQMPPRPGMPQQPQQVMMPPTPQQVPIVPQQYPHVQGQTPQYIVQPQPFVPQQPQMAPQQMPPGYQQVPPGMPQQVPGMPPPGQKPGFTDRLKTAWNALWG